MSIEAESIKHLIKTVKCLNDRYSAKSQDLALQLLFDVEVDNSDTYMADNLFNDIRNDIESRKYNDALSALKPLYNDVDN